MPNPEQLAEWQRTHDRLMAAERAVSECAMKLASAGCTEDELNARQDEVRALRLLADEVFARTFGVARRKSAV